MDTHPFTPARPGGTVCVAERRRPEGLADTELCGYPPGHPIHGDVPSTGETHAQYDARREAELPDPINVLRGIVAAYVPQAEESYANAMHAFVQLHAERATRANTPAEARVGISDRAAATLTAVAELGRTLHATGVDPVWFESRLRLIEQALLGGER